MSSETKLRHRADIDWLRVGATYLLFVFHVGKVFDPAPFFHVRNEDLSLALLVVCGFISLWHMPLFFVLAGWSIFGSLRERGVGAFARERVVRLLVPLVAGSALLGPIIKYLELRSGQDLNHRGLFVAPHLQGSIREVIPQGLPDAAPFSESFLEFWPTFYSVLDRFTWAHLWFLAYLFVFSLLYLPVFILLIRARVREARVGAAWVYAPVLPLALLQVLLRPHWPGLQNLYDDWANVSIYSVYLLLGFAVARSPAYETAIRREAGRAGLLALASCAVLLAGVLRLVTSPTVILAMTSVAGWSMIVALLGFAARHLSRSTPMLPYLVESALPVYVLHQAAIVVPGFWIVGLPLGIAAKLVLLLATSVGSTLAVYHFVVRRYAITRFLTGMRVSVPTVRRTAAAVGAVSLALALLGGSGGGAAKALAKGPGDSGEVDGAMATRASVTAGLSAAAGVWLIEGGAATVDIEPCGDALCGRVVWLRSPFDGEGCDVRDGNNPDPALRGRPVAGLEVLSGLRAGAEPGLFEGGSIYDPDSGRTYRLTARMDGRDRLRMRGYVGVPLLGRTTTWIRLDAVGRSCGGEGA